MRKLVKGKKVRKSLGRTDRTSKRVKASNAVKSAIRGIHSPESPTTGTSTSHVTRSKAARANISEGLRLYVVAGRPSRNQVIKVYGAQGPMMTWRNEPKRVSMPNTSRKC